jgi:hypothetical protein
MMKYEWKKMLWYRWGILYILLFLMVKLVILSLSGTTATDSLEQNREVYDYYMERLEGEFTQEKKDYLEEESLRLAEAKLELGQIQQAYYAGKLNWSEYEEQSASLEEELTREAGFQSIFHQYIYVRMEPETRYFVYQGGWDRILSDQSADYLGILLLLVLMVPVFCQEYSCGMDQLLMTSGKGAGSQVWSKLAVCTITAAVVGAASIGMEYLFYQIQYGLPCGNYPLQSLESYQYVEKSLSLQEAFFLQSAMKILGYVYMTVTILFISSWVKKQSVSLAVSTAATMLPFLMVDNYNQFTRIPGPWGPLVGTVFLSGTEYEWNTYWQEEELVSTELSFGEWGLILAGALCILVGMGYLMKKNNGNYWVERIEKNKHRTNSKQKAIAGFLLLAMCGFLTGCIKPENSAKSKSETEDCLYNSSQYLSGETENYVFYHSVTEGILVCEEKKTGERFPAVKDAMYFHTDEGEELSGTFQLGESVFASGKNVYYQRETYTYDYWGINGYRDTWAVIRLDTADYSEEVLCEVDVNADADSLLGLWKNVGNDTLDARYFFVEGETVYLIEEADGVYRLHPKSGEQEQILALENSGNVACNSQYIYYRDDVGILVQYNRKTGEKQIIEDVVAKDFILCKEGVYYLNARDHDCIYFWNPETGEIKKLGDVPALWMLCDTEYIYYVDEEESWLYRMDKNGNNIVWITDEYPVMLYIFDGYDKLYMDAIDEDEGGFKLLQIDKNTLEITEVEPLK